MSKVNYLLLYLLVAYTAHAQSVPTILGARANGLGNTTSCLADEWSMFNNIGGLSKVSSAMAAFSYENHPSLIGANRMAFVFTAPMKIGTAGFGIFKFGDNIYNEQIITTGYSNTFGLASLGVKFNYIQYHADGIGNKSLLSISAGGIARLTPYLSIGVYAVNINQQKISNIEGKEYLPTMITAGIGLTASDKVFITAEVEKDLAYKPNVKAGLEYQAHKKLCFRTGFNTLPASGYFGIGFKPRKFSLDYAFRYEPNLGGSHQATVGYLFKTR